MRRIVPERVWRPRFEHIRNFEHMLVDGDPMKDTTALDRMPFVFKKGVGYNTAAIFDEFRGKVGLY